jgi:hypothetical protein
MFEASASAGVAGIWRAAAWFAAGAFGAAMAVLCRRWAWMLLGCALGAGLILATDLPFMAIPALLAFVALQRPEGGRALALAAGMAVAAVLVPDQAALEAMPHAVAVLCMALAGLWVGLKPRAAAPHWVEESALFLLLLSLPPLLVPPLCEGWQRAAVLAPAAGAAAGAAMPRGLWLVAILPVLAGVLFSAWRNRG